MGIKIALAGNPNAGKTTLFNALTGSNQFVGNWPGVTVEKKEGKLKGHDDVIITDLPGIYSLSPYTPEEIVARKYLVNEAPDVILNIIDGTNIERNLYLTTQLVEIGIPVVGAVNMMDVVRKNGDTVNIEMLERRFGCKFVEISALKETGIKEAADMAIESAKLGKLVPPHSFSGEVEHALAHIEEAVVHDMPEASQRWYAIKIFERDKNVIKALDIDEATLNHIEQDIVHVEKEFEDDAEAIIANERYVYITNVIDTCFNRKNKDGLTATDKIDRIVTNRWAALPIFAVMMFLVYYISVTLVGGVATDLVETGLDTFSELISNGLASINCAAWLRSLIVDGIIAGVGSVIGFLPQMLVLFFFLAFLEACGYMSRIAFLMDKIFRKFGLSGKSFIPILIGTGCGVPGIMASRTIENERDRRMTIITTTFIPCGAKLPVIALISASLFGGKAWVAPSVYLVGIVAIVTSGLILQKTKPFRGESSPFVMELPAYHMPTFLNVMRSVWERTSSYIKKAGTVILIASIVVWLTSRFGFVDGKFAFDTDMTLESAIIGYIGNALKWLFAPLGFGTAKATVATVMGLLAKEEIVGVFGVLGLEGFSPLAGYSFLIFNILCAPCVAAMSAIRQEMNSPKWTAFAIGYQTAFAYCISLIVYQLGLAFSGNINIAGIIAALLVLAFLVFMIVRPSAHKKGAR